MRLHCVSQSIISNLTDDEILGYDENGSLRDDVGYIAR